MTAAAAKPRSPMNDVEAEKIVLGAMMLGAAEDVAAIGAILSSRDYYRVQHGKIHDAIIGLHGRGEPTDAVAVVGRLIDSGEHDRVGGMAYLSECMEAVPAAVQGPWYARKVADHAARRRLAVVADKIGRLAEAPDLGTAAAAEQAETELRRAIAQNTPGDDSADQWQPSGSNPRAIAFDRNHLVERDGWTFPVTKDGPGRPPGPIVRALVQLDVVERIYRTPVRFDGTENDPKVADTRYHVRFVRTDGYEQAMQISQAELHEPHPEWPGKLNGISVTRRKTDGLIDILAALEEAGGYEKRDSYETAGWVRHGGLLVFAHPGPAGGISAAGPVAEVRMAFAGDFGEKFGHYGLLPADPAALVDDVRLWLSQTDVTAERAFALAIVLMGRDAFAGLAQFTHGYIPPLLISGTTGSNKTSRVQLSTAGVAEVYGTDRRPDINMRNLGTKPYAIEQQIAGLGRFPILLDDALRNVDGPRARERFFDNVMSAIGSTVTTVKPFDRSRWNGGKRGSFADALVPTAAVAVTVETVPAAAAHASDLARWVWIEVVPGDITWPDLDRWNSREASEAFRRATWGWLAWFASTYGIDPATMVNARITAALARFASEGLHAGLPPLYARILTGFEFLLEYAVSSGALTAAEGAELGRRATESLVVNARQQAARMGVAGGQAVRDTVRHMFARVLRHALRTGHVAVQSGNGAGGAMLEPPLEKEIPDGLTYHDLGWRNPVVNKLREIEEIRPKREDSFVGGRIYAARGEGAGVAVMRMRSADRSTFMDRLSKLANDEMELQLPNEVSLFEALAGRGPNGEKPMARGKVPQDGPAAAGGRRKRVKQDSYRLDMVFGIDDDPEDEDETTPAAPTVVDPSAGLILTAITDDELIRLVADMEAAGVTDPTRYKLIEIEADRRTAAEGEQLALVDVEHPIPAPREAEEQQRDEPDATPDQTIVPAAEPAPVAASTAPRLWAPVRHRTAAYVDVSTGQGITETGQTFTARRSRAKSAIVTAEALLTAVPNDVQVVYLLGLPELTGPVREWFTSPVKGWEQKRTYLARPDSVSGVWATPAGREVSVYRIEPWTSATPSSPAAARDAMATLLHAIRISHRGQGAQRDQASEINLFATPAQTGRDLWRYWANRPDRTGQLQIERYAPLEHDLQQLIRTTSGQGRIELFTGADPRDELPGLVEQDLTFGYAGLLGELGTGPGRLLTAAEATDLWTAEPYARGRAHVRVTVPKDWAHIGLIGVKAADVADGWRYPADPGATFETWADGAQIMLAHHQGWHVDYLGGLHLSGSGKPLDTWRDRLVTARNLVAQMEQDGEITGEVAKLARNGLRAIVLHGVGAFVARPLAQTRFGASEHPIPADVDISTVTHLPDGRVEWTEYATTSEVIAQCAHPEWAAAIWARCQNRLLLGSGKSKGEGALTLRRDEIVAARTDALYLTRDPGWNSDEIGRFRRKHAAAGPVATPRSFTDLDRLRHTALKEA